VLSVYNISILLLLLGFACPASAFAGWFGSDSARESAANNSTGYSSLSEMANAMAAELKEGHPRMGLKFYLDREDIREDQEVRCVPFAGRLVDELERAFSQVGYSFEGRIVEQSDYLASVNYHRTADKVVVYLKLKRTKNDSYRSLKGTYELAIDKLPDQCFVESLDNKLARLSQKVAQSWKRGEPISLFFVPVVEARRKYSSPFSEYVTNKFKANLTTQSGFRLIEEKPAVQKATGGARGTLTDLDGAAASLYGADAVMEGVYLRGADTVNLSLKMKNLKGEVLANVEENIPNELVPFSLDNDDAEALANIADTEHEKSGVARISTVKGGSYRVFRAGETVSFTFQVSRPLFVYVYDISPNGEVNLIYPKEGEPEAAKQPGVIYTLPEEGDSWEIKVAAPFGKDAVKLFASNKPLAIPRISSQVASRSFAGGVRTPEATHKELASQSVINGLDIVAYYRSLGAKKETALFESTAYVETREK